MKIIREFFTHDESHSSVSELVAEPAKRFFMLSSELFWNLANALMLMLCIKGYEAGMNHLWPEGLILFRNTGFYEINVSRIFDMTHLSIVTVFCITSVLDYIKLYRKKASEGEESE